MINVGFASHLSNGRTSFCGTDAKNAQENGEKGSDIFGAATRRYIQRRVDWRRIFGRGPAPYQLP